MNCSKGQKDMTPKDAFPQNCKKVSNMLPGENRGELLTAPERMKWLAQSGNDQLWMCLVMKVKCDAAKNSIA